MTLDRNPLAEVKATSTWTVYLAGFFPSRRFSAVGGSSVDDGARLAKAITQVDGKRLSIVSRWTTRPYSPKPKGQASAPFQE
jgi:hypothetical protein